MGLALMWIEALAAAVLWTALALAVATHIRRRWPAILVGAVGIGGVLLASAGATVTMAALGPYIGWGLFAWDLSWFIAFATGAAVVLHVGLKDSGDGLHRTAAAWPRGKIAAAFAAALILYTMTFWNLDVAVQSQLANLRAEAIAQALSVAPMRIPADRNAAPLYRQAFLILCDAPSEPPEYDPAWTDWLQWDRPLDLDTSDAALRASVERFEPAAALVREAASRPGCYFERDYGRPSVDMLLPELNGFQKAARLLALGARVAAATGDAPKALANLQALFRMTWHAEQDPILISALTAMVVDGYAVRTLEALLADGGVAVGGLEVGPSQFYNETLARACRMEGAFGLTIFCELALGDPATVLGSQEWLLRSPLLEVTGCAAAYRVFILQPDLRFYLRSMHRYQNLTAMPYHESREQWERTERALSTGKGMGLISALIFPALGRVAETAVTADARHSLARLALAMERHRSEKGAYPESLDAVAPAFIPAVPPDPFDGKPLRMARSDGAIVLYSAGPDAKDDGGTPWNKQEKTGDVVFRLGPAAKP